METKLNNISKRILAIKATNYQIAAGIACGIAVSFTPFVGFHLILASFSALCMRASISASAIGTIFGNPWTFAIIWPTVFYSGEFILQTKTDTNIQFNLFFKSLLIAIKNLNVESFFNDLWPILYPMIIGSIPFYLLSWIISYIVTLHVLKKIRKTP